MLSRFRFIIKEFRGVPACSGRVSPLSVAGWRKKWQYRNNLWWKRYLHNIIVLIGCLTNCAQLVSPIVIGIFVER